MKGEKDLPRIHSMDLPRKVIVGQGVISQIGDICKDLGFKKNVLVFSGKNTMKIAGKHAIDSLENVSFDVVQMIVTRSDNENVLAAQRKIRKGVELVIGVGGGKVIDVSKLAAANERIPFISVPTAASHDGIASSRVSIKGSGPPQSTEAKTPVAIIADTHIIANAPSHLMISGCGDVIANATAVRDWEFAHKLKGEYYGYYAASLSGMCAKIIIDNANIIQKMKEKEETVRTVLEALISSGVAMCIAGSSRPASGSEHLFSHALDLIAPNCALHGEQCGVGTIMMMYLHGGPWEKIRDALRDIGAPTTAKELGLEDKLIIKALSIAHTIRDRFTILSENGLTPNAAEKLAKITRVIEY